MQNYTIEINIHNEVTITINDKPYHTHMSCINELHTQCNIPMHIINHAIKLGDSLSLLLAW